MFAKDAVTKLNFKLQDDLSRFPSPISRPKKFPPGPVNFPLIGSLLYVDVRNISNSFKKLRKK